MKILKSSGPNIDPCETLPFTKRVIYFATLKPIRYVASHKTCCLIILTICLQFCQ